MPTPTNSLRKTETALKLFAEDRQTTLDKNPKLKRGKPLIVLVEHDDDGTIHQAEVFANTTKGKRHARKFAEKLIEEYLAQDPDQEQDLKEVMKEFGKKNEWKGYNAAVTLK